MLPDKSGQIVILLLPEYRIIRPLYRAGVCSGLLQQPFHYGTIVQYPMQIGAPASGVKEITFGRKVRRWPIGCEVRGLSFGSKVRTSRVFGFDKIQGPRGLPRPYLCLTHVNFIALAYGAVRNAKSKRP